MEPGDKDHAALAASTAGMLSNGKAHEEHVGSQWAQRSMDALDMLSVQRAEMSGPSGAAGVWPPNAGSARDGTLPPSLLTNAWDAAQAAAAASVGNPGSGGRWLLHSHDASHINTCSSLNSVLDDDGTDESGAPASSPLFGTQGQPTGTTTHNNHAYKPSATSLSSLSAAGGLNAGGGQPMAGSAAVQHQQAQAAQHRNGALIDTLLMLQHLHPPEGLQQQHQDSVSSLASGQHMGSPGSASQMARSFSALSVGGGLANNMGGGGMGRQPSSGLIGGAGTLGPGSFHSGPNALMSTSTTNNNNNHKWAGMADHLGSIDLSRGSTSSLGGAPAEQNRGPMPNSDAAFLQQAMHVVQQLRGFEGGAGAGGSPLGLKSQGGGHPGNNGNGASGGGGNAAQAAAFMTRMMGGQASLSGATAHTSPPATAQQLGQMPMQLPGFAGMPGLGGQPMMGTNNMAHWMTNLGNMQSQGGMQGIGSFGSPGPLNGGYLEANPYGSHSSGPLPTTGAGTNSALEVIAMQQAQQHAQQAQHAQQQAQSMQQLLSQQQAQAGSSNTPVAPVQLLNLLSSDPQVQQTSASLYVKNLPPDGNELMLYRIFAPLGPLLSVKIHMDPATGRCKGVGFVNYADTASAQRALKELHGSRIADGRVMHLSLQAPRAMRAAVAAAAASTGQI